MNSKIIHTVLLAGIFLLTIPTVFSQDHKTKDNYTGAWETPTSWNPTWPAPQTNVNNLDLTINGYVTANSSLRFSGSSSKMIVDDTLVIKGNLTLNDNNDIQINNNGILIIRGNLIVDKHVEMIADGYLIITGNIIKGGPNGEGSLTSGNNPVKVFVGGTIPSGLTDDNHKYPTLDCTSPSTTRYPHSDCSYGDMTDLMNDPIYPFFQSTCTITTPTISASGSKTFCSGGSVTLTSSTGTTYLWSNGATTSNIIANTSGSYTVKITNASGCLSAASAASVVTVNALPIIPTITAGGSTTFCAGGSVTLTSVTSSAYLWSTGATTKSINTTTSGNYTVKVTNASGCQSATSVATVVTVNSLPSIPIISASGSTNFCAGGSVTLTSTAGYTYLWSTGATSQSISTTISGNYTVKVTNASGCQSATSMATNVTVNSLPSIPIISPSGSTTFCAGGNVTLSSTTGYTYLWSTGATTQNLNATTSGNYTVKVTNASGCQSANSEVAIVTVHALPSTPIISAGGSTTFCAGGSVTLTSSAGTSYLWSTGANTKNINITSSGSYTIKVRNLNGCESDVSVPTLVTVNALPVPTITANGPKTFCIGGNVILTSSNATSYLWSNAATTAAINVTTSGGYTVQVTDVNGCQSNPTVATIISVNALPVVNAGTDVTIPNGSSTTLNASVTGTGPFTYSWTPSSKLINALIEDPTTANLATTTVFILTATSTATTCFNSNNVTITISGVALSSTPTATPGTVCAGSLVQLRAMASGGSGLYTITWTSIPIGFTSFIADPAVNPTVNTTYKVAVFDGFNTVNSQVDLIVKTLPSTPTIAASGSKVFCAGGSIILTSSTNSTYLWSTGAITKSIDATTSGNYTVQTTSASGCQSLASIAAIVTVNAIPTTPVISASGSTTFCAGGSVTLTSVTSSAYLWSTGATTQNVNATTTGNYSVKITNSSGCQSLGSVPIIITVNASPPTPTISASGLTTFCAGGNVTLTSSTGSSYLWSNAATTQNIIINASGTYSVSITNAGGCQSTATMPTIVTVNALPATPNISASGQTSFCEGGSVTLTSGTSSAYLWSTGATARTINATITGNYSVQITNANGCQRLASTPTLVTANALPFTPTISTSSPTTFCAGNSVTLTASSGLTYLWSTGATTHSINATTNGNYSVQITNADGCQSLSSVPIVITVNALPVTPTILVSGSTTFCYGGSVILTSSAESNYLWTNLANTQSTNIAIPGNYSVIAINSEGCHSPKSADILITVNPLPLATASNNGPVCIGGALNLSCAIEGLTNFSWTGMNQFSSLLLNPSISDYALSSMSGNYELIITDANGCQTIAITTVLVNELPLVSITNDDSPLCIYNSRTLSVIPTGGTFVIISGSGSITNNVLLATGSGDINLEYDFNNHCANKVTQSIIVNNPPTVDAGQKQDLEFVFETQLNAELSSSETGEWSLISGSGQISDIHSPTTLVTGLSNGENIFLWKIQNGSCYASEEVIIKVKDLFVPSVITPNDDGKNDYFKFALTGQVELIVFNQWGIEEYSNSNYINDWNGKSNKGLELHNDTYFYILRFENGNIKKGSVLINR